MNENAKPASITIRIPPEDYERIKAIAVKEGRSLNVQIIRLLKKALGNPRPTTAGTSPAVAASGES
jgi:hypothetical protein